MQAKRNIEKIPAKRNKVSAEKEVLCEFPKIPQKKLSVSLSPQELLIERALNMPFPLSCDAFQLNLDTPLDEAVHVSVLEKYFPKLDDWTIQSEEYEKLAYAIAMLQLARKDICLKHQTKTEQHTHDKVDTPIIIPKELAANIETITSVNDTTENTFDYISTLIVKTMISPITLFGKLL